MAQQIKLAFPANNDDDKENELHLVYLLTQTKIIVLR